MNQRQITLAAIRVAGYHDDLRTATRLYTENRISRKAYEEAFSQGVRQKKLGVPCSCYTCKQSNQTNQTNQTRNTP